MNDDPVLADKVKITASELRNCRETEVETMVTPVIAEARNNMANLTDYMLTEDMIVEVETSSIISRRSLGSRAPSATRRLPPKRCWATCSTKPTTC